MCLMENILYHKLLSGEKRSVMFPCYDYSLINNYVLVVLLLTRMKQFRFIKYANRSCQDNVKYENL